MDDGVLYDVVEISPTGLAAGDVWINRKSHLIFRSTFADGRFQTDLSDYRKVGGRHGPVHRSQRRRDDKVRDSEIRAGRRIDFLITSTPSALRGPFWKELSALRPERDFERRYAEAMKAGTYGRSWPRAVTDQWRGSIK
jgi:hypothetical protein